MAIWGGSKLTVKGWLCGWQSWDDSHGVTFIYGGILRVAVIGRKFWSGIWWQSWVTAHGVPVWGGSLWWQSYGKGSWSCDQGQR